MLINEETYAKLGKLKPGMPQEALSLILGPDSSLPEGSGKGHYISFSLFGDEPKIAFFARLTVDTTIGELGFCANSAAFVEAIGLPIGASGTELFRLYPNATPVNEESNPEYGIVAYRCQLGGDMLAIAKMKQDHLLAVDLRLVNADYGRLSLESAAVRADMCAYDLEMLHRFVDPANNQGWVFGLPPGIASDQWPLDPVSGYPLMHGFTLRLPEEYRIHGPSIVALSFFSTAADQNDGGASIREDVYSAVVGTFAVGHECQHLKPFREHAAKTHPKLFRMKDLLNYEYAVILLTEDEYRGKPCQPPRFASNPYLSTTARPKWLDTGSAYACFSGNGGMGLGNGPVENTYSFKLFGCIPEQRLDWHRAVACTPRVVDPNAGIPPQEVFEEPSAQGYESPYDIENDFKLKTWAKNHKRDHIGGTMRPTQGTPEFSPFYIGFEEYFGDYNFGAGGNAQLDFLQMKFEWACG
jgi:hypothetical protein